VWLDDLSRPLIKTGGLAKMVDNGEIVGVTTNPTIFAKAIGTGCGYEDQIRELALRGTAIGETLRLLTAWDVRTACDVLRPVFERSDGRDGRVSIEVDARISGDTGRGARTVVVGRPTQSFHQDPRHECGNLRYRGKLGEWHQRQCDADFRYSDIGRCWTRFWQGWRSARPQAAA
jgi:hypothetical protein